MLSKELLGQLEYGQKVYETLKVTRKKFVMAKSGEQFWGYSTHGLIKGRDVVINFKTSKYGGYDGLDDIFRDVDTVYVLRAETGDDKRKFVNYKAVSFGADGYMDFFDISPKDATDRVNLERIISRIDFDDRQNRKALREMDFDNDMDGEVIEVEERSAEEIAQD